MDEMITHPSDADGIEQKNEMPESPKARARKRPNRKHNRKKKPAPGFADDSLKDIAEPMPDEPPADCGFSDMDLSDEILYAVARMGFKESTPIQQQTIPLMMKGSDIIAIAPTGTGKTCAFGIPMLEYINLQDPAIQEVVLAPTRELAVQIGQEMNKLAHYIPGVRICVLYGGQPIRQQISALGRHPQIVIATPGRMLDHISRGTASLSFVHTLVIDEADEMLKMGFVQDVCRIIEKIPKTRQFVMFSATTNQDVMTISWKYQHEPVQITIAATKENRPKITQYVMDAERDNKQDRLMYLLDSGEYNRMMIFVNTKFMADRLASFLQKSGYDARALHGDIPQGKRNLLMQGFKAGKFPILVATDVAARGIDVDDVEAVINYDLPMENEYYLHRIGRTGRAKKHGVSFTLMSFAESVRMDEIMKYMKTSPQKLHFDENEVLRQEDGQAFFEKM